MLISLINKGVLSEDKFTLVGLSSKDGISQIGKFGTGLKYAIAGFCRLGIPLTIYTNSYRYEFNSDKLTGIISCFKTEVHQYTTAGCRSIDYGKTEQIPMGYVDKLGKHWELWMLYRELIANTLDEDGTIFFNNSSIPRLHDVDRHVIHEFRLEDTNLEEFWDFWKTKLLTTECILREWGEIKNKIHQDNGIFPNDAKEGTIPVLFKKGFNVYSHTNDPWDTLNFKFSYNHCDFKIDEARLTSLDSDTRDKCIELLQMYLDLYPDEAIKFFSTLTTKDFEYSLCLNNHGLVKILVKLLQRSEIEFTELHGELLKSISYTETLEVGNSTRIISSSRTSVEWSKTVIATNEKSTVEEPLVTQSPIATKFEKFIAAVESVFGKKTIKLYTTLNVSESIIESSNGIVVSTKKLSEDTFWQLLKAYYKIDKDKFFIALKKFLDAKV